jgi:DNA mismatch repair protein MutS
MIKKCNLDIIFFGIGIFNMEENSKKKKEKDTSYTPMMEQYLEVKRQHPDLIILYRLGDFYEMFFDDAITCSKELQLFLTGKSAGKEEKVPMCGIPHHAYLTYVQKLLENGHKVGIVEQLEDPKAAKGIVKRDVVQIITPGANLEIKGNDNNYLACLLDYKFMYVLALADLSTGEIDVTNVKYTYNDILSTLVNYDVKELIIPTSLDASLINLVKTNTKICITYYNNDHVDITYEPLFEYINDERQITCISTLMNYLKETQKRELDYFKPANNIVLDKFLKLDYNSRVNLELTKNLSGDGDFGTLYWLLNKTKTPMGARLLKNYINEPSASLDEINHRLNMVQSLIENFLIRGDLISQLDKIYDLDRLIARVGFDSCSGKEMLQLKASLDVVPFIKDILKQLNDREFDEVSSNIYDFTELTSTLDKAIDPNCPNTIKEGGIFKKGFNEELDRVIDMSTKGKNYLLEIENKEKQRTGIKTLKVGYSKIFGYYIEVSNGQLSQIKDEYGYIRKQTMTTGERYITQELKEVEQELLHAQETRLDMEYKLFQKLREYVKGFTNKIQMLSTSVAILDVMCSLAVVSSQNNYVRPEFNKQRDIKIIDARHPVIEKVNPSKQFVSNSYIMDNSLNVLVITGPNMGGKSTYMRELALIVIMAQLGCYVPATSCSLYVFDSVFTRIGASDDLIKGESTFMVEMSETNRALQNATANSLLLFDEIGRGTATYDGMALAQGIIEYIVNHVHAKTLFSTHYHEITKMVDHIKEVENIHVSVLENDKDITFLYKVEQGPMDKSYGINVARLASLPDEVISRAEEILVKLENNKIDYNQLKNAVKVEKVKVDDENKEIIDALKKLDPLTLTPLQALNLLYELKKKVK